MEGIRLVDTGVAGACANGRQRGDRRGRSAWTGRPARTD